MKTPCKFNTDYGRKGHAKSTIIIDIVQVSDDVNIITAEWPGNGTGKHRTRNTYSNERAQEVATKIVDRTKVNNFPWQDKHGVNQWSRIEDHDIDFS